MSVTPNVALHDLGLARSALGQQAVDLVEDLLGLALDVFVQVFRQDARQIDRGAVLNACERMVLWSCRVMLIAWLLR